MIELTIVSLLVLFAGLNLPILLADLAGRFCWKKSRL